MGPPNCGGRRVDMLPGLAFLRPAEEAQARGLIARPPVVGQFQIDPLPGRQRISRPDRRAVSAGVGEQVEYFPWLLPFKPVKSAPFLRSGGDRVRAS
jgi:hypothetical protein